MSWPHTPDWLEDAIKKYRRKTDHVRLLPVIRKGEEWTRARRAAAQGPLELLTRKVKRILDRIGVYNDIHHQYHAYALALDKTQKDMAYMVDLIREHQILRNRFERRGLDSSVLDELDQFLIYRTANY